MRPKRILGHWHAHPSTYLLAQAPQHSPARAIGLLSPLPAGLIVPTGERFFEWMGIDDPINCLSAHGMSGIWGTVALGALATHERVKAAGLKDAGFVYGDTGYRLGVQIMGVCALIAWDFGTSFIVFMFIKMTFGIRVDRVAEEIGAHVHGCSDF